jgi:dGTP triphosphohydrolase
MRNISDKDLLSRYTATSGALSELKSTESRRKRTCKFDFQAVGDPFVRDLSVILSSKAYRRMGEKNQVASSPHLPHVRNRATHSAEVMAHSVRLSEHLGLNTNLALAIGAGHDIGHVPFGHQGEHYIQEKAKIPFSHEIMGVIIAQNIERKGVGLNLTFETLEGMYRHSGSNASSVMTQEAWVVRYADKIAFLFADYNDFRRLNWICNSELSEYMNWFGMNQRDRTFRTMVALCEESYTSGFVSFESSEPAKKFKKLRGLMYEEYVKIVEQDVSRFLDPIYDFLDKSKLLPPWLGIALLTDEEVRKLISDHRMLNSKSIMDTGLGEMIRSFSKDELWNIAFELNLDW